MFSIGDVVSNTSHCWRIYFLVGHYKYSSILYRFRVTWRWI